MPLMPTDLDIYRSAKLLVEQHGADALIEAALKADELLDAGDIDGRATWLRIRKASRDATSLSAPRRPPHGTSGGPRHLC